VFFFFFSPQKPDFSNAGVSLLIIVEEKD